MDRRKICRYFQRGSCKKQKCPFVHLRQNRKNCEFYLQGYCRKGTNCNFYHPPKQSQQQQDQRKNYQPRLQKKIIEKYHQEDLQEDRNQQYVMESEGREINNQQKKQKQLSIIQDMEKIINNGDSNGKLTTEYKNREINFLLGLGEESSQQDNVDQNKNITEKEEVILIKKKPLNFTKLYPKKFPDYTKSTDSRQKILQNQTNYFRGLKYTSLLKTLPSKIQLQFYQLLRKFQDSFTSLQQHPQSQHLPRYFKINLRPLLYQPEIPLHFQMIQDFFQILIDARKYPKQNAHFQIINISIPQQYKIKFVQYLNKLHKNCNIYQSLKTFINSFEKIYNLIKFKLENLYYSQIELQEKINRKLNQEQQEREKKKKEIRMRKEKLQKKREEKKEENPDVDICKFGANQKIICGNYNYEIKLDSLLLINAEYVLAERLLLFLECQCQKKLVHILEADRKQMKIGVKLKCRKCQNLMVIALQRQVMQQKGQIIGKLGIQNGKLIQLGGISWKIGCQCNTQIIKPRICMSGYRLNINCIQCFKSIQISYMGLKFHNPFWKQSQLIQDGKQLPNRGTCKHYKLNFRWIRYGCCGRTFCCDQCHENGSVYAHQIIEGMTMLCGFCSMEQIVSQVCSYCKKELIKGVDKGGHWEGGLGCRDKELLSKKDAKKYTGLTKNQQQQQQKEQHK